MNNLNINITDKGVLNIIGSDGDDALSINRNLAGE